ncbi:MAG: YraN family protein [Micrococcales bacterium]
MTNPPNRRHVLGLYGEKLAGNYLQSLGYEVLERNWRCPLGEIDLIARDDTKYVFVEVKTRNGAGFGHPLEAITEVKLSRLRRLVSEWCRSRQLSGIDVRIDAVSVLIDSGRVQLEHLKQVF